MIYNLLEKAGHLLAFASVPSVVKPTFSEVLQQIEDNVTTHTISKSPDFRALFDYKGKKVAILSSGDILGNTIINATNWQSNNVIDFANNMYWALNQHANHIICCCHTTASPHSVKKYIIDNYPISIYRWYHKTEKSTAYDRMEEAQRIAIEVFTDIKENC